MSSRRLTPLLYWGMAAIHAAAVLRLPLFPSQDGPMHLYYADVFAAVWQDPAAYGGEFRIPLYVRPYSTLHYVLVALQALFAPVTAEKIVVSGYIVLFAAAFLYLARSIGGRGPVLLLIFPFVLHRLVYLGFYNYCLGSAAALWMMGFWIRYHRRLSGWRTLVFLLGLGFLGLTHPISLLLATLFICLHVCVSAFQARRRTALREWFPRLIHAAVALAAMAGVTFFFHTRPLANLEWPRLTDRLRLLMELDSLRPLNDLAAWTVMASCILTAATMTLAVLVRRPRARRDPAMISLAGLTAACVAFNLVLPWSAGVANFLNDRFPLFAVAFLVAMGSAFPLRGLTFTALAVVFGAGCLVALVLPAESQSRAARRTEVMLRAPLPSPGARGAIVNPLNYSPDPVLNGRYSPCYWAPARYFQRARAVLWDAPWAQLGITAVVPARPAGYHELEPEAMAHYLDARVAAGVLTPGDLDFLVDVHCGPNPPLDIGSVASRIARGLGFVRLPWSNRDFTFYGNPALFPAVH